MHRRRRGAAAPGGAVSGPTPNRANAYSPQKNRFGGLRRAKRTAQTHIVHRKFGTAVSGPTFHLRGRVVRVWVVVESFLGGSPTLTQSPNPLVKIPAFTAETPPLPCASAAFATKTPPFLVVEIRERVEYLRLQKTPEFLAARVRSRARLPSACAAFPCTPTRVPSACTSFPCTPTRVPSHSTAFPCKTLHTTLLSPTR